MKAEIGDWVVIKRSRLGEPLRRAQIVELRHPDGTPPYVIRWLDTGQVALLFPGPDAHVEHQTSDRTAAAPAHTPG